MEDEASTSLDGKVLGNLRVVDLKQELEKRGLSKSGSKKDLVKRLKQQLEFEKLCEERKSSGDHDRKLELDAAIEQNEFVQQYLAQQQKRYAERKEEEKRLELEALQEQAGKQPENDENQKQIEEKSEDCSETQTQAEEKSTDGSEYQLITDKNIVSDCDEAVNEKNNQNVEPSKNEEENEKKDAADITDAGMKDEMFSSTSESEDDEPNYPLSPVVSEHVNLEQSNSNLSDMDKAERNQNSIESVSDVTANQEIVQSKLPPSPSNQNSTQGLSDVISNEEIVKNQSPPSPSNQNSIQSLSDVTANEEIVKNNPLSLSENEEEKIVTLEDCEHASENKGKEFDISVATASDHIKEHASKGMEKEYDDVPVISVSDNVNEQTDYGSNDGKDSSESSSNAVLSSDITKQHENVTSESNVFNISEEDKRSPSLCHTLSERASSPEDLSKENSVVNMESSECSSVPYSLSDIQLPESPGHHLKSKDVKSEGNCNETDLVSDVKVDQSIPSKNKIQSNGVASVDTVHSSHEEEVSESETKESSNSTNSPEKANQRKDSEDNQHSEESCDVESDGNDSESKKSFKYEDAVSNIAADFDDENAPKDSASKGQKSLKQQHQSDESEDDKSSDSDKYKRHRVDSKRKSHDKHRKRNRCSRSQSSSSSSSHSSDSSRKQRHSKKSVVMKKNKNFVENEESNQMSDKSLDEKPERQKNEERVMEPASIPSVLPKKRLKIKRDNVTVEANFSNVESVESSSSKNMVKTTSDSHSSFNKPKKQDSSEVTLSVSELSYCPRKVSLSNRKLNRKSSESQSHDPKSKKGKWDSFAAVQKASQTISISTDSLKNWFPDFKLISEPSSSMELEPDEHSLPAVDDKNTNLVQSDVSNGNDVGAKRDSTSQMDIEDSESQEPNYEDSSEPGLVSKIIFIQNLVRPFTLNQLKDLLKQNGKIVEEYFWIDKIKSKCFVMYETEKDAIKARNALNNVRWPPSNPKILSVEFSNEEELEQHKKGNEPPPKPVNEPPVVETPEIIETRISHPIEEHKRKDRERRKDKDRERSKPQPPVREWDKDKIMQDSPEREHVSKEEKSRSSEKKEKKESKKRPNEDTPAKLLDDLFQKTKNPPCIYWLPLTEEQAKQKEEAKKMRKLEREKRNQQLKEQEEAERRNKRARSNRRSREKENRKSSTRSRSPVTRRR